MTQYRPEDDDLAFILQKANKGIGTNFACTAPFVTPRTMTETGHNHFVMLNLYFLLVVKSKLFHSRTHARTRCGPDTTGLLDVNNSTVVRSDRKRHILHTKTHALSFVLE